MTCLDLTEATASGDRWLSSVLGFYCDVRWLGTLKSQEPMGMYGPLNYWQNQVTTFFWKGDGALGPVSQQTPATI